MVELLRCVVCHIGCCVREPPWPVDAAILVRRSVENQLLPCHDTSIPEGGEETVSLDRKKYSLATAFNT